jgi:hypothetical protein
LFAKRAHAALIPIKKRTALPLRLGRCRQAWFERRLAEQAAWSSPGVTAVEDKLTVS